MKRSLFLFIVFLTVFMVAMVWDRTTINETYRIRGYESIPSTTNVTPTTQYPDRPFNCNAIGNIVFVKTHKTGSTTLRTIINRYGYFNNLSFLMHKSKSGGHIVSDLRKTPLSEFLPPLGVRKGNIKNYKGYNISNTHMKFDLRKMREVMAPRSLYITILRDPIEQWLSAFQYFHLGKMVKGHMGNETDPVKVFLSRSNAFRHRNVYAWNNQLYDLGLSRRTFLLPQLLKKRVADFGKLFDLVLITEYFDESLILLRKLLCWTFDDIVYVKMREQPKPLQASGNERQQISVLNKADIILYDYFNRTLWRKIKEYGPSFERDLRQFRRVLSERHNECLGEEEVKVVGGNHMNIMYRVKNKSIFCITFVNHGGILTTMIKDRQIGNYHDESEDAFDTTQNKTTVPEITNDNATVTTPALRETSTAPPAKVPLKCNTCQGNVVFVKTHKTGSTTLTSILNRFGYFRNLSFLHMADSSAGHFNYHSVKGRLSFLPPIGVAKNDVKKYRGYNISAVHVRYNRRLMDSLMYHHNLYYITILREPVSQLLSAIHYFDVPNKTLPSKYRNQTFEASVLEIIRRKKICEKSPFAWNNQIFDLGFDKKKMKNVTMITKFILKLSKEMDLVLIKEYFDESLILLKRLLCWEFEDILYVKCRGQPPTESIRNQSTIARLRVHNYADRLLYQHFNKTLWDKIAAYGPSFDEDLRTFRNMLNATSVICVKGQEVKKFGTHINVVYIPADNSSQLCHDIVDASSVIRNIRLRQSG